MVLRSSAASRAYSKQSRYTYAVEIDAWLAAETQGAGRQAHPPYRPDGRLYYASFSLRGRYAVSVYRRRWVCAVFVARLAL
jgi:hypothetical protein